MSDFDPGPGWRMEQFDRSEVPVGAVAYHEADGSWTYWVREAPVPALPTAPYTVIRVTWREDEGARNLVRIQAPQESMWQTLTTGPVKYWGSKTLAELITSFEVMSEPRAVTAKAVLDAVDMATDGAFPTALEQVGSEFGVES